MVKVEIIKDSINAQGDRITTFMCSLTQTVVKELLRHRMFSFSSSSMRAIPALKVLENTVENLFIPIEWQKPHKGMQGTEYHEDKEDLDLEWELAALDALVRAQNIHKLGGTKQMSNRLVETFGYVNLLITATEFENFYKLRCPIYEFNGLSFRSWKDLTRAVSRMGTPKEIVNAIKNFTIKERLENNVSQAEIHIQELAEAMWDAHNESKPEFLNPGEWHIPFGDRMDDDGINEVLRLDEVRHNYWDDIDGEHVELMISAARAARLSYNTFDGEINHVKDYKLAKLLLKERHMSPFEHSAQCMSEDDYSKCVKTYWCKDTQQFYQEEGWLGNFRGFKQFRQLL